MFNSSDFDSIRDMFDGPDLAMLDEQVLDMINHAHAVGAAHVIKLDADIMHGVALKVDFDNGLRASVVCHGFSYGGPSNLWEVAIIHIPTDKMSDPIGWLDDDDVRSILSGLSEIKSTKAICSHTAGLLNEVNHD
jgi:hypothetical protein